MKAPVYIFSLSLVISLVGCASSYQPKSLTGGYQETQLASDLFRVVFRGNGYTSGERAQDFALLRAAELASQNGFTHFGIIDESNTATAHTTSTPGQTYTTGSVEVHGNTTAYSTYTTSTPGQIHTIYKPKTGLLIRCFRTKPTNIFTFDSAFLQQSIKKKYSIK